METYYNLVGVTPISELSKRDRRYLSIATESASTSTFNKRVGACLLDKKVCLNGPNIERERAGRVKVTSLHAEVNVIIQGMRRYNKTADLRSAFEFPSSSTVYVVRLMLDNDGIPDYRQFRYGISKPCKNCQPLLYKCNITTVFYTDVINDIEVLCKLRKN